MARQRKHFIVPQKELLRDPNLQEIFQGLSHLKKSEVEKVLSSLLKPSELVKIKERWEAVKLCPRGKTIREIAKEVGISTTTTEKVRFSFYNERAGWQILFEKASRKKRKK